MDSQVDQCSGKEEIETEQGSNSSTNFLPHSGKKEGEDAESRPEVPFDIFSQIGLSFTDTWGPLVSAVPDLGRWSLENQSYVKKQLTVCTTSPGIKCAYYLNGKLHREDGPALELLNGTKSWFSLGQLHRKGAPAVVKPDGQRCWYENGKLHREDGPAITKADGTKKWYRRGILHRQDGPAVENPNGTGEWWFDGLRIDG